MSSLRLPVPWNAERTTSASPLDDHRTDRVTAKTMEPSVIDFDKINSRFMMIRQQSGHGFAVADDFLSLS